MTDSEIKFYWGKLKKVKGKTVKVFLPEKMTRKEMRNHDDTYRHICKE